MEQYVIDTHALLWYVSADSRISSRARLVIERAEAGEVKIIVSTIVLAEAIDILNKKRVIYNVDELLLWVDQIPQCEIKSLDREIINLFKDYNPSNLTDIHDKIVIVTAQCSGNAPIVTKDRVIQKIYPSTVW